MAWPIHGFNYCGMTGPALATWVNIGDFDKGFQDTCYWFASNNAGIMMNLAVAMNLVIDKVNDHEGRIWRLEHSSSFDMDALLNEMLKASYEQLTQFVGIVDAYRSAIWDQPFNSQFYAALAAGFRP